MDGAAHFLDPLVEAAVHVFSPELFQKIGAVILGHIVDDGLEVVGQAVVAFLIHDHVKGGSGDVQQRDVLDFLTVAPGNQRIEIHDDTVDDAALHGLIQIGHVHADHGSAEGLHGFKAQAAAFKAELLALDVVELQDGRGLGHDTVAHGVGVDEHELDALDFLLQDFGMGLIEIAQHLIGIAESHTGVGGGKNLRMEGERAGVGAERRFGQVRYAGADGVHGVGTLAKGVGEIGFNLDAPVAALFELVAPRLDGIDPPLMDRRHPKVESQHDGFFGGTLLREQSGKAQRRGQRQCQ